MRSRGIRTVTEAAEAAVGVTAADFPAEPAAFSMRGFTNSQINILYNGIRIGPQNMTSRVMNAFNLDRIEILKGPASLMSGEGAAGGAVNYVTRGPQSGPIQVDAEIAYGSFGSRRFGIGAGGSTSLPGLDFRVDLSDVRSDGFISDTGSRSSHLSGAVDYRPNATLRLWLAAEFKIDESSPYWGTPLVPVSASGSNAAGGIVSGTYVSNFNGTDLGPVTIDRRTMSTNYNVLDQRNRADEYFLRGGFDLDLLPGVTLRNQTYFYDASREWRNNEVIAFNAGTGLVDRERFYVAHDQSLVGNRAEVTWDHKVAGMDNRVAAVLDASLLDFNRPGAGNFPGDSVPLVDPPRGTYGALTLRRQTTDIRNVALSVEDRLRLSPELAVIAGLRHETLDLDRGHVNVDGTNRPGFPYSKSFSPTTGRIGVTYDIIPGTMLYAQYATGADVAANNLFLLGATQPLELTRSRNVEAGVKSLFWNSRGEWNLAVFDIQRNNVYAAAGGRALNIAGQQKSRGAEFAFGMRPTPAWSFWGNLALTEAEYQNYNFTGGSFSGNTPPNVPRVVANAGLAYRLPVGLPADIGASIRHVGDRYHSDANTVKLLAYTVLDAFASVDVSRTRLTFRIRNITDQSYAVWSDAFYPDQILLGAPRSYEVQAQFRF
jgi:iron complex outermembrane receptor protein